MLPSIEKISASRSASLADRLQINGLDIDKNAVQRIESGQRFVTDIELKALAAVFQKSVDAMLETGSKSRFFPFHLAFHLLQWWKRRRDICASSSSEAEPAA